ncbi:MAG TPA: AAA family ATPase [Candidatus Dormibacteraeota bacterium]|nr:AAA family ATPase [Candidatus Dormibacteraeota bacterium]
MVDPTPEPPTPPPPPDIAPPPPPPSAPPVTAQAFRALTPLLALVWIATGVGLLAYLLITGHSIVASVLLAAGTMLYVRGLFTVFRRAMINREILRETPTRERRIVDIGRAASWRRILWLSVLTALYFGYYTIVLNLDTKSAVLALPDLIGSALTALATVLALLLANVALFFGPFLLYARMGLNPSDPGDASWQVKLSDVRGQNAAVGEMQKILRLIEQGNKYVQSGGLRERGILMVGPPGTGKTMLAKAIASELQLPIIVTSGASFAGMFLGMDVLKVLMMSRMAKKRAKKWGGCAVFIDEFDVLGSRRAGMGGGGMMGGMFGGGMMALNMLLVVMDGLDNPTFYRRAVRKLVNGILDALFIIPQRIRLGGRTTSLRLSPLKPPRYNIFFMGATNRPSVLDEAITRPGRFGRQIIFKMPDFEDRKDIADLYFSRVRHDVRLDEPETRDEFARITKGYSPAMIQQALSVGLMYAFEHGREGVIWDDLREAMANIEAGLAEPIQYTDKETLAVARHEMGHAVANRFFLPEMKSVRLSIRKRGGALGHHQAVEAEESFVKFRSRIAGEIRWGLGSIAVERVFYGENTSGVSGDLASATREAAFMVGIYGMGPDRRNDEESLRAEMIGFRLIAQSAGLQPPQGDPNPVAAILHERDKARDVAQIMGSAYVDCWRLMLKNKDAIDRLARVLMEKKELVGREIDELLDTVHLVGPEAVDAWPDFLFSLDGGPHLCPRCHRLLPEGARYCLNCGESIVSPFNPAQTSVKS